jgi:hypothetical protein
MSKKSKRTKSEKIAHLERSIKKFGDIQGDRTAKLEELRGGSE